MMKFVEKLGVKVDVKNESRNNDKLMQMKHKSRMKKHVRQRHMLE